MPKFALILPAAGRSVRFGGPRGKLQETLRGQTVIRRAVDAFLQCADLAIVVIATTPPQSGETISPPASLTDDGIGSRRGRASSEDPDSDLRPNRNPPPIPPFDPRIHFTPGGQNRAESVLLALRQVPADVEWVAIHDAARPLVSQALIERTLAAAVKYGAAVPALPVALTIKQADGPLPARVERTVPRQSLWAMQTPQVMRRSALLAAYAKCPLPLAQVTDDAQLLESAGEEVWLVEGEERNLKITTQADLRIAEMFLEQGN